MEGFAVADGGRALKIGLLGLGGLLCASPVFAQASDPLAPLSTTPAPSESTVPEPAATQPPLQPIITQPPAQPVATVVAPKDWRGVFDAIDSGNWASARAGIVALPPGILKPVAKAELYTAKGSPLVDLGSLQALLAEAPELPQADQLARMAWTRGAT